MAEKNTYNSPSGTMGQQPEDYAESQVRRLKPLSTMDETAESFKVSPRTIRRWTRSGRLRALKTSPRQSGRVLIPRSEVARLLLDMLANCRGGER